MQPMGRPDRPVLRPTGYQIGRYAPAAETKNDMFATQLAPVDGRGTVLAVLYPCEDKRGVQVIARRQQAVVKVQLLLDLLRYAEPGDAQDLLHAEPECL